MKRILPVVVIALFAGCAPSTVETTPGSSGVKSAPVTIDTVKMTADVPVKADTVRTESRPTRRISYRVVSGIFEKRCGMCHYPGKELASVAALGTYADVFARKDRIRERVVVRKDMPMGLPMSSGERALIARWITAGAPK
jgi:uncharacterized membrane protein